MSESKHTRDLTGDLSAGHYVATATVRSGCRNLFDLSPGGHHIGTLTSGSKTQLQRFDADCDKIVRALHMLEIHDDMLRALKETVEIVENNSLFDATPLHGLIAKAEGADA